MYFDAAKDRPVMNVNAPAPGDSDVTPEVVKLYVKSPNLSTSSSSTFTSGNIQLMAAPKPGLTIDDSSNASSTSSSIPGNIPVFVVANASENSGTR
jgi:hypothetical protein